MAGRYEVLQALYTELQAIVVDADVTSVTPADAADHVGLMQRHDGATYPYVGIEVFDGGDSQSSMGIGNIERIVNRVFDDGGSIQQAEKRRKHSVNLDIGAIADGGDYATATQLLDSVERRLREYEGGRRTATKLQTDVTEFEYNGRITAGRPDDNVAGERLQYQLTFVDDRTVDVEAIEHIELTIEDDDTGADYSSRTV